MNAPASFWRRYAAYSLDTLVIGGVAGLLAWPRLRDGWRLMAGNYVEVQQRLLALADASYGTIADPLSLALDWSRDPALQAGITTMSQTLTGMLLFAGGLVVMLAAAWFIGFESSTWQASPGKRLLGLRVTDKQGERCSRGRIALRFVAAAPSWLLFNLGHAMAASPEKRALHDYLAGTRAELAPDASAAMPRWAVAWLWLQAAATAWLFGFVMLRYLQLLWEISGTGPV